MITTDRDRKTCEKYSRRDSEGYVHCHDCPLKKGEGKYDARCKANSHYDRKSKEWEFD